MEFDIKRVYTAVNADELKIGSKVVLDDTLVDLKKRVEDGDFEILAMVRDEGFSNRFVPESMSVAFNLCYLISQPEEKKLKWTDLKLGDVIRWKGTLIEGLVIQIDRAEVENPDYSHVFIGDSWISDEELAENWEKVE